MKKFEFEPIQTDTLRMVLQQLRLLLNTDDLPKRKAFLSSFLDKVEIFNDRAVLYYRNPANPALLEERVRFWVTYASPGRPNYEPVWKLEVRF